MGRTGKMWAVEHFNVIPDIICIAKAIAGGLPLGITLARSELMNWHVGAHASTFGGNPVAIAAALKTIELLEKGVIDNAARIGQHLKAKIEKLAAKHKCIIDVRGLGLMIGIDFAKDPSTQEPWPELRNNIVLECFNRGMIVQGAGESAIRLSPPLIITEEQADFAANLLDEIIGEKHSHLS
jgi:4-aminobutyrate aminotransferase